MGSLIAVEVYKNYLDLLDGHFDFFKSSVQNAFRKPGASLFAKPIEGCHINLSSNILLDNAVHGFENTLNTNLGSEI